MNDTRSDGSGERGTLLLLAGLAAVKILLHLPVLTRYGSTFDEPYFAACGEHLSFGYVDHAPLVPWLARLSALLFGDSLAGLRLPALLATAAAVFLTGRLAGRLGGGRFAQVAAAVGVLVAPVWLRSGNMLCLSAFEPLFWILASGLVVRIIREEKPRLWLWVGAVVGLGMLNKHSMLFYVFGLVVGMALSPLRRQFRSPWLYAGGGLALALGVPNLVWQIRHDWPTLHFVLNLNEGVMSGISPLQFVIGQFLYLHPFNAVLWIAGLVFLLISRDGRPYRALGWIWPAVFLLLLLVKSKIYYLAPAYPLLLAAGGVALERHAIRAGRRWLPPVAVGALVLGGIALGPLAVPFLDIDTTERYVEAITFHRFGNVYELTGDLRAMFGSEERVAAVAAVYHALPPEDREQAIVWASNYGYAGDIDRLGDRYGLPRAACLDLTYWLWGIPGDRSGDVVILAGYAAEDIAHVFEEVETAALVELEHVNPWQTPFPVVVGRKPVSSPAEIWAKNRPW